MEPAAYLLGAGKNSRFLRSLRLACVLCLLLMASFAASAAIRFDLFIGYDSIIPQGAWFPATFEIYRSEEHTLNSSHG